MKVFLLFVLFTVGESLLFRKSNTLAKYVPEPLKAHLPKQLLADLNRLTTKDVAAASRIAERWTEFSSDLNKFEKIVGEESKPLKSVVDNLIKIGHREIDSTVAKMDEPSIKFFQKAGKILTSARDQLSSLYEKETDGVKESLHKLFPRASMLLDHPEMISTPVNYCSLFGGGNGGLNGLGGLGGGLGGGLNGLGLGNYGFGGTNNNAVYAQQNLGNGLRRLLGYYG